MADVYEDRAVRNFIAFGLKLIGKLGDFRELEEVVAEDEIHDLRLQLEATKSALRDEIAHRGIDTAGVALAASLSVANDLKIRFDSFDRKLHNVQQVREFKDIVNVIWPRHNVEELDKRLSTIRAALT
jgi:hypothetical protein